MKGSASRPVRPSRHTGVEIIRFHRERYTARRGHDTSVFARHANVTRARFRGSVVCTLYQLLLATISLQLNETLYGSEAVKYPCTVHELRVNFCSLRPLSKSLTLYPPPLNITWGYLKAIYVNTITKLTWGFFGLHLAPPLHPSTHHEVGWDFHPLRPQQLPHKNKEAFPYL